MRKGNAGIDVIGELLVSDARKSICDGADGNTRKLELKVNTVQDGYGAAQRVSDNGNLLGTIGRDTALNCGEDGSSGPRQISELRV